MEKGPKLRNFIYMYMEGLENVYFSSNFDELFCLVWIDCDKGFR
jgi:hypothetical protein